LNLINALLLFKMAQLRNTLWVIASIVCFWSGDSNGQGTIVYQSVDPISVFSNGDRVVRRDLDLDNDSLADIRFQANGGSLIVHGLNETRVLGTLASAGDFNTLLAPPLPSGFEISTVPVQPFEWLSPLELGPDDYAGSTIFGVDALSGPYGPFRESGYMAFQLNSYGESRNGWLYLEIPFPDFVAGGYIEEWAYNDAPGQSIFVAQVPEPSTSLLLVGGGGFLCWQLRRRARDRSGRQRKTPPAADPTIEL